MRYGQVPGQINTSVNIVEEPLDLDKLLNMYLYMTLSWKEIRNCGIKSLTTWTIPSWTFLQRRQALIESEVITLFWHLSEQNVLNAHL
jgi:hypothetical protein